VHTQIHFHASSLESLHEHFDADLLPEELGGKLLPGDDLAKVIFLVLVSCSVTVCANTVPCDCQTVVTRTVVGRTSLFPGYSR